jgi:UDP-N-acetylmuramyl pentapeptide phosphotransferase/UDP-N-acetylglucosamine-1-phosphate transferase
MRAMLLASAGVSFFVALAIVRVLLSPPGRFALDQPNERSLHVAPVPRTGGLAIVAGVAAAAVVADTEIWWPLVLALLLAAVSLYDDLRGLDNRARLVAHVAAASTFVWYSSSPMHPAAMMLLVLALVWITNLYNFMDGADGVAGGMALIGFTAYAIGAWLEGHVAMATTCAAIAAASAAFLLHNFHPARIFLGDVGSIPLGFLAAALGLLGWREDLWPLWFPLLVFGPFNADATITLIKRLLRRQKVWRPHRDHYYQRIVRMGLGHRTAALMGYLVMALCAAAALLGRNQPPAFQAAAFGAAAAVLGAMAVWVDVRWARFAGST